MRTLLLILMLLSSLLAAGCEIVGDIFQAGLWVGVILVLIILAAVGFVARRLRR